MAAIVWDDLGAKQFELGVDHGILSVVTGTTYGKPVAWNGLVSVTESPSGAEANKNYADNIEYANILSAEEFGATIEAYTYPDEFRACDGYAEIAEGIVIGQQNRAKFGFAYRTKKGNDTEGQDYGYQIHFVYGAQASPSERAYNTINDSPELITLSWEITTTPIPVPGFKPTAKLTVDSTIVSAENMKKIEDMIYGTADAEPKFPLPAELITLMGATTPEG